MIGCAFFGQTGRDAEIKTSRVGNQYLRLSVRVGDGDTSQWLSVLYFGDDAAALAPQLERGAGIYVEGTLQVGTWTKSDGTMAPSLTVMATFLRLPQIGNRKPKRERTTARTAPSQMPSDHEPTLAEDLSDEIPF